MRPDELVARAYPVVLRHSTTETVFSQASSGRQELADWIASKQHPLTARVYVNRLWRWHFGAGLVRTTDNFGAQGARPSHPQLLDWLAHEFMRSGWSTKAMHRLILTSSVYQQRSAPPHVQDPDNRWLAHFPVQRLTAEAIRDAWLAVSGRLDRRVGGKTVPLRNRQFVFDHTSIDHTRYDSVRRSVYLPVIRNNLYDLFRQFDFPDPTLPTGSRTTTVVAPSRS